MQKKITISIDETVYDELHRTIGRGQISHFIEDLIRANTFGKKLDDAYKEMASDNQRESEALEWCNGLIIGDSNG
jgi:predicted CopG family antitoxin